MACRHPAAGPLASQHGPNQGPFAPGYGNKPLKYHPLAASPRILPGAGIQLELAYFARTLEPARVTIGAYYTFGQLGTCE